MTARHELLESLASGLDARRCAMLLRAPVGAAGLDLTSNDALSLGTDPALAAAVAAVVAEHGAGGKASRLLGGESALHRDAEAHLAAFSRREAALLFSSGFALNVGLLPALTRAGDVIFSDRLNHASLIDGMRLAKASVQVYDHQDMAHLERLLKAHRETNASARAWVVTESVFSMDGDTTDLATVAGLAERHGALVIVDEAHATGLYGPDGAGRVAALGLGDQVLATVHTGGKALGVGGAWIATEDVVVRHLVNFARSFIYSTAVVPAIAGGLVAATKRVVAEPELREALHAKAIWLRTRLRGAGFEVLGDSHIVPVVIGSSEATLHAATELRRAGFGVHAVRPPTVPEGTARLRLAVQATTPDDALERLAATLEQMPR